MTDQDMPRTDSISELASFWDSHDVTDYEKNLEEISEPVFDNKVSVNVPLDTSEFEDIEKIARTKGISDSELLREWIREKLRAA